MRGGCRRARRLDGAYRRSTAGGRAEEIQRGRRKSSSKPRVSHIPQGLANAGAVISRKIPVILSAIGNWKRGSPAGGKPVRLSPSGKDDRIHPIALFIVIKCTPATRQTRQLCFVQLPCTMVYAVYRYIVTQFFEIPRKAILPFWEDQKSSFSEAFPEMPSLSHALGVATLPREVRVR